MKTQNQTLKLMNRKWKMCLSALTAICALSIKGIAAPVKPAPCATIHDARQAQRDKATATLFYAISVGNQQIAINALRQGANPNAMDKKGNSVLHLAVWSADAIIDRLLRAGANPNSRDKEGKTPLFHVPFPERARLLLNRGADAKATDNQGRTVLHNLPLEDVYFMDSNVVLEFAQIFIAAKANVNARDKEGNTPLHFACEPHYAQLLMNSGANMELQNEQGDTPLLSIMRAAGGEDFMFSGLEWRADATKTISMMLSLGASPTVHNKAGNIPLHLATVYRLTDIARLLLEKKADVNAQDMGGNTPLHLASQDSNCELARLFIERGANVNARNKEGKMPLPSGSLDLFSYLLEKGADPNAIFPEMGGSPLSERQRFLIGTLLEKGASINVQDSNHGSTALHFAAMSGNLDMLKFLIGKGAKVNVKDKNGLTPLDFASGFKVEEMKQALRIAGGLTGTEVH